MPTRPVVRRHTWLRQVIKILLGGGVIVLLFRRTDINGADLFDTLTHLSAHPLWLALTLVLVLLCLLCGAGRWWTALTGLAVPISGARTAALFLIGHFFNGFLPGSTGGDVARAFYIARDIEGCRATAVMSIVVERLAGVATLMVLTLCGLLATTSYDRRPLLMALAGVLAIGSLLLLLGVPGLSRFSARIVPRLSEWWPQTGPLLQRLYGVLQLCHTRPRLILSLFGWSLLQHLCAVLSWVTLAWGLGFSFDTLTFLLLVPAVLTAQMIPITPGGLGVREGTAIALLPAAGLVAHEAMLVALASFAASLVWSAAGGLIYLLPRNHRLGHPPR